MAPKRLAFPPGLGIPELHRVILSPRNQRPPIRTEDHALNPACMPHQSLDQLAVVHVPDAYRLFARRRGGQPPAVRTEGHGINTSVMSLQSADSLRHWPHPRASRSCPDWLKPAPTIATENHAIDLLGVSVESLNFPAARHLPEPYGPVQARRGQSPPIRTECHSQDTLRVPAKLAAVLGVARRVPQLHHSVVAGRGQPAAIRTESHASDKRAPVPPERADLLLAGDVPELHHPVIRGRGQLPAIRTERHAVDPGRVPREDGLLPGGRVPEPCRGIFTPGGQGPAIGTENNTADLLPVAPEGASGRPVVASQRRTSRS